MMACARTKDVTRAHARCGAVYARRFKLINGVLIPGGGQVLSPGHPFYDAADHLLQLALGRQ